jgi:ribose-phosphate pyrophosphokinase
MSTHHHLQLISASRGGGFAAKLAERLGAEVVPTTRQVFSEGNLFVSVNANLNDQQVIVVQSLSGNHVNDDFMELLFYLDACKRSHAASITAVIPFFSYAKSDKQDGAGTSIRARICADCLQIAGAQRVIMMDLHSPSIPGFFQIPVTHVSALEIFATQIRNLHLSRPVIVAPDAGFAKQARVYSNYLGLPCVICDKNRADHSEHPRITEVIGEVGGRTAIIVDDYTTSGGTLMAVTQALLDHGARAVYAAISHAPLTPLVIQRIQASPLTRLFTTNSVPDITSRGKIKVIDASAAFACQY